MSRTTDRRGGRDGSPRVVVVDDSPFMRGLISDLLSDAGVAVVGEAGDGEEALSVVAETRPDVVTMDVEMPGMGGLEAVERLMEETPTPVLMLSAHTDEGAEVTFEALDRGAVDFFAKPGGEVSTGVSRESDRLVEAVRSVAGADLDAATRERDDPSGAGSRSTGTAADPGADAADVDEPLTVVIAASTGGPNAVERVLSALPMADCRVVIVQHMPEAFTSRFADRLDAASAYDVREASDGARIGAGEALVARGGSHTVIDSYRAGRLRVKLDADDDTHTVTPAADVTMRSAAEVIDDPLVGVVLTGMGSDAAEGIRAMADAGARTLAQSEDTCVIYGMPKRAVETGGVDAVYDLDDVAGAIVGGEA
ncbi:chemotaxis-specific protein-glutamate methyltransferase CheB [Halorubrum sp. Atlit-8R]|uniref:chemotaxis-specific protein-glutamate methyltransferase CheB n=1 Tax=unclassified Halorubrum TaxID=2642239 RepID=UPI000EF1C65E|nr:MULTISPECIES: chemotaxis-specific protein-glutamate methyltransferase CheB [unclassified Halorubrum]RLM63120.1 chemotaxis-specific protein-glutamate methyltransferase CheB [Halorubrum sp. Atlit-9R]RLM82066.1 chemotaxis-specific protein-glutamate methyltransferase CheB [Halorubrum sp. Atlit-8R]